MKRHMLVLALLSGTMLAGCDTLDAIAGNSSSTTTTTTVTTAPTAVQTALQTAEKALTSLHLAHKAAADFATLAAQNGWLHGADATTTKTYLDQSETYLEAADAAFAIGDADGVMAKISAAQTLIDEVHTITGQTGS